MPFALGRQAMTLSFGDIVEGDIVKERFAFTDVGQAIIDAVEAHPYWEMSRELKWIYDKLKEQRDG